MTERAPANSFARCLWVVRMLLNKKMRQYAHVPKKILLWMLQMQNILPPFSF